MKIVIDANVYASSLIKPEGTPGKLLQGLLKSQEVSIVGTTEIINELERILQYPKVRNRISLGNKQIEKWLIALGLTIELVDIQHLLSLSPIVSEDTDDDKYILAALASKAGCIITGDQHLLKLDPYHSIAILKPSVFIDLNKGILNDE